MIATSHKWLGDTCRMLGEFRRAREHHEKHLELGSSKIGDVQDGKHSTIDINAICRKECIKGAAKEYVLDKMKKMAQISVGHDDQNGKIEADLTVAAKDSVHKVIQVASVPIALMCPRCYPFIRCCKVHILVVVSMVLCALRLCVLECTGGTVVQQPAILGKSS